MLQISASIGLTVWHMWFGQCSLTYDEMLLCCSHVVCLLNMPSTRHVHVEIQTKQMSQSSAINRNSFNSSYTCARQAQSFAINRNGSPGMQEESKARQHKLALPGSLASSVVALDQNLQESSRPIGQHWLHCLLPLLQLELLLASAARRQCYVHIWRICLILCKQEK